MRRITAIALIAGLLGACQGAPPAGETPQPAAPISIEGDYAIFDTATGLTVSINELADALAEFDVVFIGEQHTNKVGHRLEIETTEALFERRGKLILSLEMFERDVQESMNAYLAGEIDEEEFRSVSRPWPNYEYGYRPGIELAKREGLQVLAANIPRPLASRVVREGLTNVLAADHAPRIVMTPAGEYRDRFNAIMGGHGDTLGSHADNVFAAQCIKDATMAESISDALSSAPGTLVVHWCGKFHSDAHLGTVERLAVRRPELSIAVITMTSGGDLGRPLDDLERHFGEFVFRVPAMVDPSEG